MRAYIITIAMLAAVPARAQDFNFARLDDGTNVATLTTSAEHGLGLGVGYGRVVELADWPLVLGGDLTFGGAEIGVHNVRVRAGALAPLLDHGPWKVIGGIAAVARTTKNDIAQMVDVGADVSVLAGRYAPHWFVVAEGGFDGAFATHIANTDTYRMLVYPDARDGWYRNTGGLFRVGIQAGASFGGNDIVLRVGAMRDYAGNPPLFPLYATLSYDRRW